jgi:hypothetical protein
MFKEVLQGGGAGGGGDKQSYAYYGDKLNILSTYNLNELNKQHSLNQFASNQNMMIHHDLHVKHDAANTSRR